uniref:Aminotransferase-like plant mobile domain-containing protein n=1 Tax=Fagus sylvatica TaxID=28930 RepID=A0A2N9FIJ2_FAGSY
MRGGRVGFIENRARLAQHHHARRMTVLRELWYCHVAVLSFHASSPSNPPRFPCAYPFLSDFRGQFWRSSGTQNWVMRHIVGKLSTSSFQRYKVCTNRSSDEGVMAPGSRGIGAVFVHSSGEDSDQTGDAFGEPRVPRRSRSHYLSNAPGLADQLVASRKDSAREGGSCAAYFCKVPDSRESELGLVRYGPASRVHRGVFGPFEGSFPIRIPADPDKFLAIREFHVVHGCVLFPMCPGSQINLLRVRKTLCASAATSVGKFRKFQHSLISSACFHARGRRSSRCRIPTILVSSESLRYLLFNGTGLAQRGGQFDPVFGLVNSPVKPWSNLVNLGQTWSDLVKALQTLGSVPRTSFQGFLGKADPSRAGNSSVKPRSNFEPSSDQTGLVRAVSFCAPTLEKIPGMSDRGSGSGGHRRSDRLAKGKAVIYAPESPPDTDDEYDAMEDVRTRVDASLARDLQAEFDAEAAGLSSSTARPSSRPGITIGRSARPSSAPRQPTAAPPAAPPARSKRRKSDRAPLSADPIPEDHVVPGFRYPPQGGIRPRYPVTTPVVDTSLLTNLHNHPSSSVRRCQDPPESIGRGGWSEFSQLLDIARPEYRDFLVELGFGPFLSIRYVHVRHPLVRCWVERFFHHTGTIHLSTCEVGVLPVDWSAILGIRFGGRIPPSDPVSDFEALEILGIDDPAAIVGKKVFSSEDQLSEGSLVGMFRDIDDLRDYDWGALTYGFYIRGLRRFSRRETASFLGFWQFTLFWAFEHFAVFAPSRLPAAPDSAFPLARRWDSAWIQRLTTRTLMECRTTSGLAMELSRLRIWIRSPRSWELLMGERTLRQLGGDALVPVDPPQLMTIEDYIPRAPSDSFVAGVEAYPALILADVPYREWFEQVSLGSLMSLHEVEGGRVMGGSAMDSHLSRSSGEFEWLQTEILRLQLELSGDLTQSQRDLGSRDAVLTAHVETIRRLEDQLHGMGITPVTGAGSSGLGQTSSSPPPDPVSRDWFFDDPPSL